MAGMGSSELRTQQCLVNRTYIAIHATFFIPLQAEVELSLYALFILNPDLKTVLIIGLDFTAFSSAFRHNTITSTICRIIQPLPLLYLADTISILRHAIILQQNKRRGNRQIVGTVCYQQGWTSRS
jgi:hypothetical protein